MKQDLVPIRTALFSVTNKSHLEDFAKKLREINSEMKLIASGGTATSLSNAGIAYTPLSLHTGFPECFAGRVKTLHPKIAGGILWRRDKDQAEARQLDIEPIDLVVCNLYDFEKASEQENMPLEELIESMDIGGSTLIRSAVKNFASVAVIVDPSDYPNILQEMQLHQGKLSLKTREALAVKALNLSSDYEALLAQKLSKRLGSHEIQRPCLIKGRALRYGENPDQKAWIYEFKDGQGIAQAEILSGKELSYNNYEDATLAYHMAAELKDIGMVHAAAIIKHGSLCACATGPTLATAFSKAWDGDTKSAFGSIVAFTSPVSEDLIEPIKSKFVEVLIAPDFSRGFVEWAKASKPNLRLLKTSYNDKNGLFYKTVSGGMLLQTKKDRHSHPAMDSLIKKCDHSAAKRVGVVTKQGPHEKQKKLFDFAISAVYFAKSNAIVIAREYQEGHYQVIGMGVGQPNRVDSLQRLALPKSIENLQRDCPQHVEKELARCVMASDGFFPFDDSVRFAASQGIKFIIQPGGSAKDQEVIDAANELNLCMIFTGERYFYH
jgi:phosphoribosylaminoimidazolecarboxamide formyltransferase / IMP cyclohydrolase